MRRVLRAVRARSRGARGGRAAHRLRGKTPEGAGRRHPARRVREDAAMKRLALLAWVMCSAVWAQDYPSKPVRMVVGFPPGGGTDVVARIIVPRMSELLGQSVVIDNRPGATGTVAAGQVAKAPPDGYTLMMGHVSVNAIAPALFSNLSYDVLKDFSPIAIAAAVPHLVTVHPSLQVHSLRELVSYLKG